ncbi:NAD-dependent DNA ligase LigA [Vallitalea pronyensis]|uniref:DNA ligase n=1 Tax=Vallitalea pronyensis TaxID=1348613 RepID=A0A8J8SGL6_9FIRM|nr:NAD-dependent DNA ligase LigA [Vallitalea pronyensis]QUI22900.1 NAD-dependent DNA ligase LigA [Vallitalea pronyensis]
MDTLKEMKVLVAKLNEASKAYYQEDREIMSNYDYDELYDQLVAMEEETGIVLSHSPTSKVGYTLLSNLPKEKHKIPMLSLDKTKDILALKEWIKDKKGIMSWKLDGLTIVLTYKHGELVKAVTRGNGEIGEVITNNAKVFKNIPLRIAYDGEMIVRGEAVIKYSDFKVINDQIVDKDKYKNPRNLCSGTVRQLNNEITAKRNVHYFAFAVVEAEQMDFDDSKIKALQWLESLGFDTVDYQIVNQENIGSVVEDFENRIKDNDFGSDGLVVTYDSITYSRSVGQTSKFPRHSIAYKWSDEIKATKLIEIEWSASRTGAINPIAIFEPIELEGTTVKRASLHNVSILESLELISGDTIEVYKANMIIPQVAKNLTKLEYDHQEDEDRHVHIPEACPVCGGETDVKQVNDVKVLYCLNLDCQAKKLKSFTHFVGRDAMNIEGLSESTLQKFIEQGFIKTFADIYRIEQHKEAIIAMEGLGEKSYVNLIDSIEKSKHVALPNFIYALGILNVGLSNAKLLCKHYRYDFDAILCATEEELMTIEGYGGVIAKALVHYFGNETNRQIIDDLLHYIVFQQMEVGSANLVLEGKTFVITGSLERHDNRKALKERIEHLGGKVTSSVTSKTDYLINNNTESTSSKNKKAKELDVPIINEEAFLELIEGQ